MPANVSVGRKVEMSDILIDQSIQDMNMKHESLLRLGTPYARADAVFRQGSLTYLLGDCCGEGRLMDSRSW